MMSDSLEEGSDIGQVIGQAVTGNPMSSLTGLVARFANKATITPQVADKLSDMLMSKNPAEVASVVKFLEQYEKGLAPKAVRSTAAERGTVMGSASAIYPSPQVETNQPDGMSGMGNDIEKDILGDQTFSDTALGSDIEADIEADLNPK